MSDSQTIVEDAVLAWLGSTSQHGQTLGIVPRRFEEPKLDAETGELDPLELPRITAKAETDEQLHPQLATYRYTVTVTLAMSADETPIAEWDAMTGKIDRILLERDLKDRLTHIVTGFICNGIVTRMPGKKQTIDRHWEKDFILVLWASCRIA